MTELVRVKGFPELRRNGAAVINVDNEAYKRALKRRAAAGRIDRLESDVAEMKADLKQILEALRG